MLKHLCKTFVDRAETQGFKGKKREDAFMEFMVGAYAALHAVGHEKADYIGNMLAMVFSVRGYSECLRIANTPDAPEQSS